MGEAEEAEANLSFTNFLSTVLLLSNVSCLEKFSLELQSFQNIDIVKSWISTVIKCNIKRRHLYHLEDFNGDVPLELPQTMFISKTLVDLTLNGLIFLKIPTSVWLPSLKILTMDGLVYENGDSAQKFLHGCPVLENLYVYRGLYRESAEVFNISVPTLKHLVVSGLDLACDLPEGFSLENLSSLVEACFQIDLPIHLTNILKLLRGIANVKCLRAIVGDKTIAFLLMDKGMSTSMSSLVDASTVERGVVLHKMIHFNNMALGGEGYLNFMGNEFSHPQWIDFPREGNSWSYDKCRRQWDLGDTDHLR